jgi:thiol-disulfide isomerase/thioredoxin
LGVEEVELRELIAKSDRPYVLINFFATWCKPCRNELPDLIELQNDTASEVKVLLVSIDKPEDSHSKLRNFLSDFGVNFQTYTRPNGENLILQFYPMWDNSIPLSLLYNKQGKMLEVFRGLTDRSEIELMVNKHKHLGS